MRRFSSSFLALLAAGCATAPGPSPTGPAPRMPAANQRGELIGLSSAELVQRFGQPALRVREGPGVKLQFASAACVLDAYLYPPAGGAAGTERVSHVDARRASGEDIAAAECLASLSRR